MTPPPPTADEARRRESVADVRTELRVELKNLRRVLDRIEALVPDDGEDPR